MTNRAAIFFESVRAAVNNEELLRDRMTMCREQMLSIGAVQYDDMPKNPNATADAIPNAVIRYQGILKHLEDVEELTTMVLEQAYDALEAMRNDGVDLSLISEIEYYYCWNLSSKDIAKKVNRSESSVRNRRRDIISHADKYVPRDAA